MRHLQCMPFTPVGVRNYNNYSLWHCSLPLAPSACEALALHLLHCSRLHPPCTAPSPLLAVNGGPAGPAGPVHPQEPMSGRTAITSAEDRAHWSQTGITVPVWGIAIATLLPTLAVLLCAWQVCAAGF